MIQLRTLGSIELHAMDGRPLNSVLAQPKRVALLTYLAVAQPRGFHRRDALVAFLWPDLDTEHARTALRKAVYHLRQGLGNDAVAGRGEEELALALDLVWCDAVAFEEHAAAGRHAQAMELYRGQFLAGFHVSEAPDFERWVDRERDRLQRRAAEVAWALADQTETTEGLMIAVQWARRAVELGEDDEPGLRRLMALLDRAGDRVGALRTYEEYRRRMAEEHGLTPSAATQGFAEELRVRSEPVPTAMAASAKPSSASLPQSNPSTLAEPAATPAQPAGVMPDRHSRRWPAGVAVAGTLAALVAAAVLYTGRQAIPGATRLVAVGRIQDYSGSDSSQLSSALADMLSSNLARVSGLQVLSNARMYELVGKPQEASGQAAAMIQAAKRAGATELVDGALYRRPDGSLRLDLRRVALSTGTVQAAHTVEGRDAFALVDRATAELAAGFDKSAHGLRVADVTTRSLAAYGLYERGLRELYQQGDERGAHRHFRAAAALDSSFAMAAYYAWRTGLIVEDPGAFALGKQAARMTHRASDRERLVILAGWNEGGGEPAALAIAETLAIRYPYEPDGHYALGKALGSAGHFLEAVAHLQQVIAMDSGGQLGNTLCRSCDALIGIADNYLHADSFAAAERAARELVSLRPQTPGAWGQLAGILAAGGRYEEAQTALRTAATFDTAAGPYVLEEALVRLRAGDYANADRLFERIAPEPGPIGGRAMWYRMISLRNQGRLREALALALRVRTGTTHSQTPTSASVSQALPEAVVRFDRGELARAAALFDSLATRWPWEPWQRGKIARHRAWLLTHVATALAAAGDTARLSALADSIEEIGHQSAYGRDGRLHHYVRALKLMAAGRPRDAEREFRQAVFSWTFGYTRTNYELGRLLLELNRPREAVTVLQPALRGALDASNLYITRTEIRELLARGFDAAGKRDSAAAYYRAVVSAWQGADPEFQARRAAAERRLGELERSGTTAHR